MRAVIYRKYGSPDVLELTEMAKPAPKTGEVLIKIEATSVTVGDLKMRRAVPAAARLYNGLLSPKRVPVLGFELAGVVESVGENIQRFKAGDKVFGFAGFGFGAYAEYRCLPENGKSANVGLVAPMPDNMSFEEAAVVPYGALLASKLLRNSHIQEGQQVLVVGASGSVGTFAVQLAAYFGAEVTGVCSAENADLVRRLGAKSIIDYKSEDFAAGARKYDLIFDAAFKSKRSRCHDALAKNGSFVSISHSAALTNDDLLLLKTIIEEGKIESIIDRSFPLESIVEAHTYVEQGKKAGCVAITASVPLQGW